MDQSNVSNAFPKDYQTSGGLSTKDPEKLPWYVSDLEDLSPEARDLFEKYSKVPTDQVVTHIKTCRDKAFRHYPYPCLGRWAFLELSIKAAPQYDEVLQRIKDGQKFLDVGCCVGQDIRQLVFDGAPSENTYGSDLEQSFMDIGYELFLDKSTSKTTFLAADILQSESRLNELNGQIDIIHAASFFHLFSWDDCVQACRQTIKILKPQPGSLLFGRQIGNVEAGEHARRFDSSKSRYRHNEASFKKMWKDLGEETSTEWEVDAKLGDEDFASSHGFMADYIPPGSRWLQFSVRRI